VAQKDQPQALWLAFAGSSTMAAKMSFQANLPNDALVGRFLASVREENVQIAKRNWELIGLVSTLQASLEALQEEEAELAAQHAHILQSIPSTEVGADMNTSHNINDFQPPEQDLVRSALQGGLAQEYGHSVTLSEPIPEEGWQKPLSLKAALAHFSTPRHDWVYVNINTLWAFAA